MATLTISISRTSLGLSPLVLSGSDDGTTLGVMSYQPPPLQARVEYADDVPGVHGSEAVGWSWQQSVLGFDFVADVATEAEAQAAKAELVAAVSQFSFTVTTQVSGAPAEGWSANPGSVVSASSSGRTTLDLVYVWPAWSVAIPVYPIPG